MATVVIMPGGFHPFHAGHLALYNSARRTFPDAEVFVAATNDTSARPFPFAVKEKLAKLAGVEPGHFVQVKSPFRANEITSRFDPAVDQLIFVRSEKDADQPPRAGGVKKDGQPAYLQPLLGAKRLEPFAKHAYMAYLPTVEFGPGLTSATEIRTAWPQLNDQRKTALVMSLYPATQKNPKLAATVVKMLDTAMIAEEVMSPIAEFAPTDSGDSGQEDMFFKYAKLWYNGNLAVQQRIEEVLAQAGWEIGELESEEGGAFIVKSGDEHGNTYQGWSADELTGMNENQGWAATFTSEDRPVAEKKDRPRDAELIRAMQYIKQHYPTYAADPELGMAKWLQRSIKHSEENDREHNAAIARLNSKVEQLAALLQQKRSVQEQHDFIDEKWSEKYKRSINCSNPRGFSQRAHCQGRKK